MALPLRTFDLHNLSFVDRDLYRSVCQPLNLFDNSLQPERIPMNRFGHIATPFLNLMKTRLTGATFARGAASHLTVVGHSDNDKGDALLGEGISDGIGRMRRIDLR